MSTQSMEEVKADYISSMGVELGASFYELYRKLVELHVLWQQYRQLFGVDPETVQLLNRTAGLFFKIVQDELWDSVLLGISRMTDPPATGRNKNLTVQSLPLLLTDPAFRAEVQDLCGKAVEKAEFAREHRNKRIAHQDHAYLSNPSSYTLSGISRARIEAMLAALRAILNRIESHFGGTPVMYEDFIDDSGARLLVYKLKKFELVQAKSSSG